VEYFPHLQHNAQLTAPHVDWPEAHSEGIYTRMMASSVKHPVRVPCLNDMLPNAWKRHCWSHHNCKRLATDYCSYRGISFQALQVSEVQKMNVANSNVFWFSNVPLNSPPKTGNVFFGLHD